MSCRPQETTELDLRRVQITSLSEQEVSWMLPGALSDSSHRHVLIYRLEQRLFVLGIIRCERVPLSQKILDSHDHF